ncbi:MAG TPA: phosphate acyltransferase PlsX [Candidatus Binataceae bacterium]|nr:phosphate acyltransferase PlsX [Candidatus Binataceae bacterium]
MRIALDAMGGDFAPQATVEGAVLGARELDLRVVLVGDRSILQKEMAEHDCRALDLVVEHAPEVVTMDDAPLEAVLSKPQSSLHVCYQLLKRGDVDAVISAGNSGAMMTIGITLLGNLAGIDRPAIASMVPTVEGLALLVDAGANTEAKAVNLAQFAVMGSAYMRRLRHLDAPKVGILANGEEASKGTELTRTAAALLAQSTPHINFIGYVEGRDINQGKADVVVTDGFTGNVALKTMEGCARLVLGNLRDVYGTSMMGRLSYLLVRKRMFAVRERLDPAEYGGAPLLGLAGRAIIAHGSSDAKAIRNALRAAANESLGDALNRDIIELLGQMSSTIHSPTGGKGIRAIFGRMRERLHLRGKEAEGIRKSEGHADAAGARAELPPPAAGKARTGALLNGTAPAVARIEGPRPTTEPAAAPPSNTNQRQTEKQQEKTALVKDEERR